LIDTVQDTIEESYKDTFIKINSPFVLMETCKRQTGVIKVTFSWLLVSGAGQVLAMKVQPG